MPVKKGRRILLTEKELREVEEKRRDGFTWKDIGRGFSCSSSTVRKRYMQWENNETEFDSYIRMSWWEKVKYAFKEVLS